MDTHSCKIVSRWAGLAASPPEWWWKRAAACLKEDPNQPAICSLLFPSRLPCAVCGARVWTKNRDSYPVPPFLQCFRGG